MARLAHFSLSLALPLALVCAATACAVASGETSGGEARFDASVPVAEGGGSTFTDIYRDLLGPTSPATCAGNGACHGSKDQPGAKASGFVCASTKTECRETLLSSGLVTAGEKDFTKTGLYAIIRRQTPTGDLGRMPKASSYSYSPASVTRLGTWVANGAPND